MSRRFYTAALVSEDGLGVLLDARPLRTPGGIVFRAPNAALARAVAGEWEAQGESIAPVSMPLTQFAFAALDGGEARAERVLYALKFAETDLCCHRAEGPADLVAHQSAVWDPLVAWGEAALGVRLKVVTGVLAAAPDTVALDTLAAHAEALDDFALTALAHAAGLTGSALIAFALVRGEISPETAFAAAALDELWSLEHWGEDAEARGRLEGLKRELAAVASFIEALSE